MGLSFNLEEQQLKGLAALRDLGSENLKKAIDKFKNHKLKTFFPKTIEEEFKKLFADVGYDAKIIVRQLFHLYKLRRQSELEPKAIFEGLLNGISEAEGSLKWEKEEIDNWKRLKPQIIELLSLPLLEVAFKATELTTEYDNILQNTVVLTDIRPIYNETATEIEGTLVTFTLRLQYFDKNRGSEVISLALDIDDVKKMIKSGQRAIEKAKTAKEFLIDNGEKPVIIMGEE